MIFPSQFSGLWLVTVVKDHLWLTDRSQNDNSSRKAVKDPESSRLRCAIEWKIEFSTLALNIHFAQLVRPQTAQFFVAQARPLKK